MSTSSDTQPFALLGTYYSSDFNDVQATNQFVIDEELEEALSRIAPEFLETASFLDPANSFSEGGANLMRVFANMGINPDDTFSLSNPNESNSQPIVALDDAEIELLPSPPPHRVTVASIGNLCAPDVVLPLDSTSGKDPEESLSETDHPPLVAKASKPYLALLK
jgi:hypothetical protein